MSTDTSESKVEPDPPDWSKLTVSDYTLKPGFGGQTCLAAFHEITSNARTSSNYNCVVKYNARDYVPVIVTGVGEGCLLAVKL